MTAQELFGVIVRTMGLAILTAGVIAFFGKPPVGLGFALVGLTMIRWADWIVETSYAAEWSFPFPRVSFGKRSTPTPSPPPMEIEPRILGCNSPRNRNHWG